MGFFDRNISHNPYFLRKNGRGLINGGRGIIGGCGGVHPKYRDECIRRNLKNKKYFPSRRKEINERIMKSIF